MPLVEQDDTVLHFEALISGSIFRLYYLLSKNHILVHKMRFVWFVLSTTVCRSTSIFQRSRLSVFLSVLGNPDCLYRPPSEFYQINSFERITTTLGSRFFSKTITDKTYVFNNVCGWFMIWSFWSDQILKCNVPTNRTTDIGNGGNST